MPTKLWKGFLTNLRSSFGVSNWRFRDVEMKQQVLKAKQDFMCHPSEEGFEGFSNIHDSVRSNIQNCILYNTHVIQSPI